MHAKSGQIGLRGSVASGARLPYRGSCAISTPAVVLLDHLACSVSHLIKTIEDFTAKNAPCPTTSGSDRHHGCQACSCCWSSVL